MPGRATMWRARWMRRALPGGSLRQWPMRLRRQRARWQRPCPSPGCDGRQPAPLFHVPDMEATTAIYVDQYPMGSQSKGMSWKGIAIMLPEYPLADEDGLRCIRETIAYLQVLCQPTPSVIACRGRRGGRARVLHASPRTWHPMTANPAPPTMTLVPKDGKPSITAPFEEQPR
jgi:hypothetical protein